MPYNRTMTTLPQNEFDRDLYKQLVAMRATFQFNALPAFQARTHLHRCYGGPELDSEIERAIESLEF